MHIYASTPANLTKSSGLNLLSSLGQSNKRYKILLNNLLVDLLCLILDHVSNIGTWREIIGTRGFGPLNTYYMQGNNYIIVSLKICLLYDTLCAHFKAACQSQVMI